MTKGEQIDAAWRLGFQGDYSLIEKIICPEYLCLDHRMGLEANFESEKVLVKTMSSIVTPGPCKILYENEEIVVTRWFSKYNETELRYIAVMSTFHFREGKIFRQEVVRELLDYDPSEGQNWNWEDYE